MKDPKTRVSPTRMATPRKLNKTILFFSIVEIKEMIKEDSLSAYPGGLELKLNNITRKEKKANKYVEETRSLNLELLIL
ncbi:MAG: hypothetical protein KJO50_00460 [Bacteroidia bacterium]|nr:hypothetical protein [Bacteroidia bacterium]MBT8228698.1 hypothetical protein [Bacteroidia bacterium]NNK89268.1 hypothetical protein [Saprospiraceae bacterium]